MLPIHPGTQPVPAHVVARLAAQERRIRAAPGFQRLSAGRRLRFITYARTVLPVGGYLPQRTEAIKLLTSDPVRRQQPGAFMALMQRQPGLPDDVEDQLPADDWHYSVPLRIRSLGIRRRHFFRGAHNGRIAAVSLITFAPSHYRGQSRMRAHRIYVYRPLTYKRGDAAARRLIGVRRIAAALDRIDPVARSLIRSVEVNPRDDDSDDVLADGEADFTHVVDLFPATFTDWKEDLETTLEHETGHVASQNLLGYDGTGKRWKLWRTLERRDRLVPSIYAKDADGAGYHDPQEDFAETWALYLQTRGTPMERDLRILLPHRYQLVKFIYQLVRANNGLS